jgi:hypothetical protein
MTLRSRGWPFALLLVTGCAPATAVPPVADPGAPVDAPLGGGSTPPPATAPASAECAAGKPGACPATGFVIRSLCFDSADAACACGGCKRDACRIAESGPAQVSCN